MTEVDLIMQKKSADKFVEKDAQLDEFKSLLERLVYLGDLNENFLYERFLPALKLPSSTRLYEDFTQNDRDALSRLRHRALVSMLSGAVPVAPSFSENPSDIRFETLLKQIGFAESKISEVKKDIVLQMSKLNETLIDSSLKKSIELDLKFARFEEVKAQQTLELEEYLKRVLQKNEDFEKHMQKTTKEMIGDMINKADDKL